tara:strand:+ start:533 stop:847 length:315 start_codon:yes stop_codon:yes gene_type:complete
MPHDHGHHHHDTGSLSDRRLAWAVAANVVLTVAQIIGGIVAGSLALVADALHNLNDAASLGLALFARKIARRPAHKSAFEKSHCHRLSMVADAAMRMRASATRG